MRNAFISGLALAGAIVAAAPAAQALPGASPVAPPAVEQIQYRWERGQVGPGGGWVERGEGPRSWAERGPPPWATRRGPPPWAPAYGRRYREREVIVRRPRWEQRDRYVGRGYYNQFPRGGYGGDPRRGGISGGYAPGENR